MMSFTSLASCSSLRRVSMAALTTGKGVVCSNILIMVEDCYGMFLWMCVNMLLSKISWGVKINWRR